MKNNGPNPELLAEYGTDEFYYRNLEKRAADTELLGPMLQSMQGGWGKLVVDADRRYQGRIDSQRLQAEALNVKFRRLEGSRFTETRENFGGAGTQRSRYQRQMLSQPYMIHPMYAERAMPMTRLASVTERVGKKMAKEAAGPDDPHAFYDPGGLASSELRAQGQLAQAAGRGAVGGLEEAIGRPGVAVGEKMLGAADAFTGASQALGSSVIGGAKAVGVGMLAAGSGALAATVALRGAGQATKEKLKHLWRSTPLFTPLVIPQKILSSVGRGVERYMTTDIQRTPRWGTGVHVPANVNEYGIAVGGARLGP